MAAAVAVAAGVVEVQRVPALPPAQPWPVSPALAPGCPRDIPEEAVEEVPPKPERREERAAVERPAELKEDEVESGAVAAAAAAAAAVPPLLPPAPRSASQLGVDATSVGGGKELRG